MKLAVTGSAGFLGTNLWKLFQNKYDLIGLDKYSYASNVTEFNPKKALYVDSVNYGATYRGNCTKIGDVNAILKQKPDAILALACESHNNNSLKDPSSFYFNNVIGTQTLLEAVRLTCPETRVYVVVTDEVLKHKPPYFSETSRPAFREHWREHAGGWFYDVPERDAMADTEYHCTSPYSSSKMCQEAVVHAYRTSYSMDIVIIRPTNIYGPYQYPEKLISLNIKNALDGKPIEIYGLGEQWRDYCFVNDTVDAIDLILQQENPKLLYHISANDERQNKDVAYDIAKAIPAEVKFIECPRKASHDFSYSLSSKRVRDLGWKPKVTWEEGLQRTIEWYKR